MILRGADRRAYLQGILTNDIAALTPGTGCYAAMLTAQGRMIADMRVLELGEEILLGVPRGQGPSLLNHLERFVFSEDVQVEDVTETRAEIGLYGPHAPDVLKAAAAGADSPSSLYASTVVRIGGFDVLAVRGDGIGVAGFDLVMDRTAMDAVTVALAAAGAARANDADVEAVRIESGHPWFGADMSSETIPLEAGLEDRAISRSKGCYVGQEVIVRVQDRGQGRVARRLVGLTLDAASAVPPRAAAIRVGDREIGAVTSAVWSPSLARPVALGYVHRDFVEPGTQVTVDGEPAVVAALPLVR